MYVCMYVCMYVYIYIAKIRGARTLEVLRSSQCSTTGVTKAVVCAILSVG